jgi:HK97 family phage portal protein
MASFLDKWQNKRKAGKDIVPHRKMNMSYNSGSLVTSETAMKVSGYYRGIVYISTQIAKLPLLMKDSKNSTIENSVFDLLNINPNDEMTAFDFKVNMVQMAIHEGNSYAEIERNIQGQPVKLHLLDHSKVEKWRSTDGTIVYRVLGGSHDGSDVFLPYRDMLHFKNFITTDGQVGQGIVRYAQDTLGISLSASKFAGGLFQNGGMPSGVITVEGELSDEAFARIKSSWKENHGGQKTGGTAVFEEGAKYTPLSFSPDVMQFLESRKFGVLEIARFLGLPPTKLFDGDSATYNNIEHANLEVALDTLDSWARNIESEIDVKLSNRRKTRIRSEFDMYAIFRGDMNTRSNYFQKMMQNAAITPNEIREKEGMAPYEGGDRVFLATNNFSPIDRVDEIIDAQVNGSSENETNNQSTEEKKNENELNNAALEFLKKRTN